MTTTSSVAQPLVALADTRGRVFLTLARWLAYAEGMILFFGACMMVSSGAVSHSPNVALGAAALAIMSLTLGLKVGRGSAPAAMILLGLSISRGVATALPGSPEWWTTLPQITMLELIVFGFGVHAALAIQKEETARARVNRNASLPSASQKIARPAPRQAPASVARQSARPAPQATVASPASPAARKPVTAVPREYLLAPREDNEDETSRSRRLDVIVAGTVAVLSMMAMMVPVPTHSEGLQGFGEGLIVLLGVLDFALAIVLVVSGHFARTGSRWGERIRRFTYFLLGSQAFFGVRILFSVATMQFRH